MSIAALVATTSTEDSSIGPGLLGFLVVVGLAAAVFVLYRSLRRQLKRIDFDPEGRTDAERMGDRPDPDDNGAR